MKNRKSFLILALFVLLSFYLYNLYNSIFFVSLGLCLLLFCLLFLNIDQLLLIVIFLIPNIYAIKINGSETAILGYFLFLVEIKYFFVNKKFYFFVAHIIHVLCVSVTALIYNSFSVVTSAIRTVFFLSFVYCFFKERKDDKLFLENTILFFIYGSVMSVLTSICYAVLKGDNIWGERLSGVNGGINFFAAPFPSVIAMAILFIINSQDKRLNITILFEIIILCFGIFLSASRTAFISLLFNLLLLAMLLFSHRFNLKALKYSCLALVILIPFATIFESAINMVLQRFTESDVQGANNRVDAWKYFIELTLSSPLRFLFGNGPATLYLSEQSDVEHNTAIQIFSTTGIIGTITMVMSYVFSFKVLVQQKERIKTYCLVPLICLFVSYFALSAMYSDQFNVGVLMSLIIVRYHYINKKENVN